MHEPGVEEPRNETDAVVSVCGAYVHRSMRSAGGGVHFLSHLSSSSSRSRSTDISTPGDVMWIHPRYNASREAQYASFELLSNFEGETLTISLMM